MDSQRIFSWNSNGTEFLDRVINLDLQMLLWILSLLWKELAEKGFLRAPFFLRVQVGCEILAANLPFISLPELFSPLPEGQFILLKTFLCGQVCETEFCLKIPRVGKAWLCNQVLHNNAFNDILIGVYFYHCFFRRKGCRAVTNYPPSLRLSAVLIFKDIPC